MTQTTETTRKLVTVRKIDKLSPIKEADFIELAHIDGWQCVVKKGEFQVGDYGLYFEIDSAIPAHWSFIQFLAKNKITWCGNDIIRIKTMKLRGELSQGLLLPLEEWFVTLFLDPDEDVEMPDYDWRSYLPAVEQYYTSQYNFAPFYKIVKWEKEEPYKPKAKRVDTKLGRFTRKLRYTWLKPMIKWFERKFPKYFFTETGARDFPGFIPKTDEPRVQNLVNKLNFGVGQDWYQPSIKLDGSSMTVFSHQGSQGVCSRNLNLPETDECKYWQTAKKYRLTEALKTLHLEIALQGELMGPGIQGNKEKFTEYRFFVFKIWDINGQRYLTPKEKASTLDYIRKQGFNLEEAPLLPELQLGQFAGIEEILAYAQGPSINSLIREGIVFQKMDGTFSFKAISNEFLLKYKE